LLPLAVAARIALLPAPERLPRYAWCSFAIFAGVIVGLIYIAAFLLIGIPWMALIR
jgi:hypothetical protein